MVFAGEGSWRWRMLLASTDRSHELFWRQAARWISAVAPDPVTMSVPDAAEPGDRISVEVVARDRSFVPAPAAVVDSTLTLPNGDTRALEFRRSSGPGRYAATVDVGQVGLYRVHAEGKSGTTRLGEVDRWFYVGGSEREFANPRLNEGFLRRAARASNGQYVQASEASRVGSWLQSVQSQGLVPERRDLWHEPWAFAVVVSLLSAEWILRRLWGLR